MLFPALNPQKFCVLLVLLPKHPQDEGEFHPWGASPAPQTLWKGLESPLKAPKSSLPSPRHTWAATGLWEQTLVFGN